MTCRLSKDTLDREISSPSSCTARRLNTTLVSTFRLTKHLYIDFDWSATNTDGRRLDLMSRLNWCALTRSGLGEHSESLEFSEFRAGAGAGDTAGMLERLLLAGTGNTAAHLYLTWCLLLFIKILSCIDIRLIRQLRSASHVGCSYYKSWWIYAATSFQERNKAILIKYFLENPLTAMWLSQCP